MREHLILCGNAKLTSRENVWREAAPLHLNADRKTGNVNLRIADITDKMTAALPDVAADLVELATYVYCADQAVTRGGDIEFEYGQKWRRRFRFEIPVRCPDVWNSPTVMDMLAKTLGFLSDDNYEFGFSKLKEPPPFSDYLDFDQQNPTVTDIDEVILFSGGIDSLGGAVEEILCQKKKVALVSHRPVSKISKRQTDLVELITDRVNNKKKAPFHVPVLVNKDKDLGKEYTQRTRSFLYASIASAVAHLFNLNRIRFYENGVVSLNMPICAQVIGGRATRTTHPQVMRGYQELFTHLYSKQFQVENPFLWKTKTDVISGIKSAGQADLCRYTVSCTRTWSMTKLHTHCGKCSQCIDRRLAALAAGLSDKQDPEEMYKANVLMEGRDEPEYQTMIERMIGTANEIEAMHDAAQFGIRFGEVSRVLRYIGGRADDVAQRVFDLHQRHAKQVCKAIDDAGKAVVAEMRRKTISPTCLLNIALGRSAKMQAANVTNAQTLPVAPVDSDFMPTADDSRIILELGIAKTTLTQAAIEAGTKITRKTVGLRLNVLEKHKIVNYPNGNKKGAALTERGRKMFNSLRKCVRSRP